MSPLVQYTLSLEHPIRRVAAFPVPARCFPVTTTAFLRQAVSPRHIRRSPSLEHETPAPGGLATHHLAPKDALTACAGDGGAACKGKGRRSVYLAECVPVWGSASNRGFRAEMEDASAAVPCFADEPVRMLAGPREMDALGLEVGFDAAAAVRLPAHLFGVYDGHGGSEVANYCRNRIHVALSEVLNMAAKAAGDLDIKEYWEKVFLDCFQMVDDEVSVETSRFSHGDNVGSTAAVAVVCSSHVIIANCGDSRGRALPSGISPLRCPWITK